MENTREETAMRTSVKVVLDKVKHPERYCPAPRCLWKTATLNRATQKYEGGGRCPHHGGKDYDPYDQGAGERNRERELMKYDLEAQ